MSARRGHGEGSVYKRASDGFWCATVELGRKPDGTRHRKVVTAKTKAAAVAKARKVREQHDAGLPVVDQRRTVAEYLDWWLATVLPGTVKPSTEQGYRTIVDCYITPHIGRRKLADLSPADVKGMLTAIAKAGKSARTQGYARAVLRRALRHAEQYGLVVRNVAAIVDGPKHAATKLDDALTAEQAAKILAVVHGGQVKDGKVTPPDRLEALAVLVLRLGLRKGEALALRWENVDLDGAELTVGGTLRRDKALGLVVDAPKTERSNRTIPLVGGTAAALKEHKRRQAAERLAVGPLWTDSGHVFTTATGEPLDPSGVLRWWQRQTIAADLGKRRFHASRHTAATLLLDAGVPLEVVSAILGHASLSITADVYARVTSDAKRRALTLLELPSNDGAALETLVL